MSGQEIPEAFQELIAEPGWYAYPDGINWVWAKARVHGALKVWVWLVGDQWRAGAVLDSVPAMALGLGDMVAVTCQLQRVYAALGLPDEGAFAALSELAARWGGSDCVCVKPAREEQITPAWNPDDYDLSASVQRRYRAYEHPTAGYWFVLDTVGDQFVRGPMGQHAAKRIADELESARVAGETERG